MASGEGRIARLERDEYTGATRCLPCTVVNLCLAFLLALGLQVAAVKQGAPQVAFFGGIAVFALGTATVFLRGYLVPGTPALTERYLPDAVLYAFGKDQRASGLTGTRRSVLDERSGGQRFDVETALVEAGVLVERSSNAELRLAAAFEEAVAERAAASVSDDAMRDRLIALLDRDRGSPEFDGAGELFRARVDGTTVGTWESRPAFLADTAAGRLLADRVDGWNEMSSAQRGRTLRGLRVFLTTCPACSGSLSTEIGTVETCCSTRDVTTVTCDACNAPVFESGNA